MLTRELLKERLRPPMMIAGEDATIFSDLALPIALDHFRDSADFDNLAIQWNDVLTELIQELLSKL